MPDHGPERALHHILYKFEPLLDFALKETLLDGDNFSVGPLEASDAIPLVQHDIDD